MAPLTRRVLARTRIAVSSPAGDPAEGSSRVDEFLLDQQSQERMANRTKEGTWHR
jgi:hypothetical protein